MLVQYGIIYSLVTLHCCRTCPLSLLAGQHAGQNDDAGPAWDLNLYPSHAQISSTALTTVGTKHIAMMALHGCSLPPLGPQSSAHDRTHVGPHPRALRCVEHRIEGAHHKRMPPPEPGRVHHTPEKPSFGLEA